MHHDRSAWLNRQVLGGALLLIVLYAATQFVVRKYKRTGQMTVVEAQAMDMSAMKPPVGATPVVTAKATRGPFEAAVTYTGTVVAFNEEDVYPRVTGWIREMPVYAGDRVQPGQLIARLDSTELASRVNEAAFARLAAEQTSAQMEAEAAQARAMKTQSEAERIYARGGVDGAHKELAAARSMTTEAKRNVSAALAMIEEASEEVTAAQHAVTVVKSELTAKDHERESMDAERQEAQAMLAETQREVDPAQAEVTYWRNTLKRSEALARTGAISQQELEKDRADARTAEAKLQQARDRVSQRQAGVRKAEAHLQHLHAEVAAKTAELAKMEAEGRRAQAKLKQTRANAQAMDARVTQTQASAEAAEARVTQMKSMLDKSEAAVRTASAGVEAATRKQHSAGASALQMSAAVTTASIVKGYTEIRANVGGVVTQRLVSPGVLVGPGTPILKIAQIDRVRLQASVAEQDAASVSVGNLVRVRSVRDSSRSVETKITSVFPAADPTARTVIVEALALNPKQQFIPGQFLSMEITTHRSDNAVLVPSRALVEVAPPAMDVFNTEQEHAVWTVAARKGTGKTIYTCTMHPEVQSDHPGKCPKCGMTLVPRERGGDNVAHLVHVKTGGTDGKRTVILSGLDAGDKVIVDGQRNLREGDPVMRREALGEIPVTAPKRDAAPSHEGHEGMQMPRSP